MDPQAFSQTMAQYGPQQQQPSQSTIGQTQVQPEKQPAQSAPTQHGNWFTHLLPTIGGVGGGLLGAVFGGGVGGIAGGAGGSGLGKALENELEGQSIGSGVAGQAALGGIGEGVGNVIGKVGGKILGSIGNKSGQVADDLVKGQVTKGALNSDTANTLRTLGATDSRQWQPIANVITGQDGALNQGVLRTLRESDKPIDFSGLSQHGNNLVAENQMQLNSASIPELGKTIQSALLKASSPDDVTQLTTKGAGKVVNTFTPGSLQNILPENAFGVAKNFEDLSRAAANSAYDKMGNIVNPDQLAKYKVFKGLADEAKNLTYGGDTPIPLTDEIKATIIKNLGDLKNINPAVHDNIISQVQNATNIGDLRGIQAPFVQGSKAVKATEMAADRGAGTTAQQVVSNAPLAGAMAAGPHGAMAGLLASTLRSPTADRAMIPLVQNGGQILSNIGEATLGKASAGSLVGGALGTTAGTVNNAIQGSNNGTVGAMDIQPNQMQTGAAGMPGTPQTGLTRNDLITLALYSPGAFSALTGVNADQQQKVSAANSAEQALQGLGSAPSGGLMSHVMGNLGIGGTGEYQRKAQSAAQQIAAALPGSDAKAIERQLTDYNAGSGNVNEAIQSILSRLSSVVNNNKNSSYESLMNYQPQSVLGQVPRQQPVV